jgi:hypothetical protein
MLLYCVSDAGHNLNGVYCAVKPAACFSLCKGSLSWYECILLECLLLFLLFSLHCFRWTYTKIRMTSIIITKKILLFKVSHVGIREYFVSLTRLNKSLVKRRALRHLHHFWVQELPPVCCSNRNICVVAVDVFGVSEFWWEVYNGSSSLNISYYLGCDK